MITAYLYFRDKDENNRVKEKKKEVTLDLKSTDKVKKIFRTGLFRTWFMDRMKYTFASGTWTKMPGKYGLRDTGKNVMVLVYNDQAEEYADSDSPIGCDKVSVVISTWPPDKGSPYEEFGAIRRSVKRLRS